MSLRSRRTTAFTTLGVASVLGLSLAPASGASIAAPTPAVAVFAPQLVTVNTPTRLDKDRLLALGLDVTEHAGHDYVEVVVHTAADEARLRDAGFTWDVRIPDLLAKRISIGKSVEGRDLTGIEIGRDVTAPEDGRPVFLMFGAHHAREWPSAELPMEFAHDLLTNYGKDDRITRLLDAGRAVIVPVSNPDGYDASRTSGDAVDLRVADGGGIVSILATPGNAYKRKNCRYVDGRTQSAGTCVAVPSPGGLGVGIDLNRNYGALWGGPGASSSSTSATYRGPAPFSEPETQAIRTLISTRQVTTLITNHTFSNLILRPVGVNPKQTAPDGHPIGFAPDECFVAPDGSDAGMQALGERMAAQNGYSNQFGWELYDTTGTTEDYSYNATGGYGYTFEVGPNEFHPPYEQVVAEYTGATDAAKKVTPATAPTLTTKAADDCGGDAHQHESVGGGNREAFLVAFENAVDAATHSVVTGAAPAGTQLTLERTGVFPLWDRSTVADTVATSMVMGSDGTFTYHANPSTRPFVASRKAPVLSPPKDELSTTGSLAPQSSTDVPFSVKQPASVLRATVRTTRPVDGQVVNYSQFHLRLVDAAGTVVAEARAFGPVNTLAWTGPGGAGVPAGEYTLRVTNNIAPTGDYTLEAATLDVLGDQTPGQTEQWTLTCTTPDGVTGRQQLEVARGGSVDVGAICTPTDVGDGKDNKDKDNKDKDKKDKDKKDKG
jgi:hypothetical protein